MPKTITKSQQQPISIDRLTNKQIRQYIYSNKLCDSYWQLTGMEVRQSSKTQLKKFLTELRS